MTRGIVVSCEFGMLLVFVESAPGSASGRRGRAIALRGVASDEPNDATGKHDLPVVVLSGERIGHGGNRERQERADSQAKQNTERYGFDLASEEADQDAADEAFERGADDDRGHFGAHFGIHEGSSA